MEEDEEDWLLYGDSTSPKGDEGAQPQLDEGGDRGKASSTPPQESGRHAGKQNEVNGDEINTTEAEGGIEGLRAKAKEAERWRKAFEDHLGESAVPREALDLLLGAQAEARRERARAERAEKRVRELEEQWEQEGKGEAAGDGQDGSEQEVARLREEMEWMQRREQEAREEAEAAKAAPGTKEHRLLAGRLRALREENRALAKEAREGRVHGMAVELAMSSRHAARLRRYLDELRLLLEKERGVRLPPPPDGSDDRDQ